MLDGTTLDQLILQIGEARPGTFVLKDPQLRYVHVNRAFAETVGLAPGDIIGKSDLQIGLPKAMVLGDPAANWPGLRTLDEQAIAAGASACADQPEISQNAGAKHDTRTTRTPVLDGDGKVIALLVQSEDVSQFTQLRRRFDRNLTMLENRDSDILILDTVMASLIACRTTQDVLEHVVSTVIARTRADGAFISMLHESGDYLECLASYGERSDTLMDTRRRPDEGLIGRAWTACEPIYADDANEQGSAYRFSERTQVCALPILLDRAVAGVLTVTSGKHDEPDADLGMQIPLLERIARLAGIAIANTRLLEASDASLRSTQALGEVSRVLNRIDDVQDACDAVCGMLMSAIDVSFASCYLLDEDENTFHRTGWSRVDGEAVRQPPVSDELLRDGIPRWCIEHGRPATISRCVNDVRESAHVHAFRRSHDIGCTSCMPLMVDGRAIGALLVARRRDRRDLDGSETGIFRTVANQLATAMQRHALSRELEYQAFHDALTGLANRRKLEAELQLSLENAREQGTSVSVLVLDLDGFKLVNDSHGHAIGDRLLNGVAMRLQGSLRDDDLVARMGGDEFAVIVRQQVGAQDAEAIARRLLESLNAEFEIEGRRLQIGTSIGISSFPADGESVEQLLRYADMAMYEAKNREGDRVSGFDRALGDDLRARAQLTLDLREALESSQFHLVYQPQIRCRDGAVIGVEALLRWQHPERGFISPGVFIPMAERIGQINRIGDWVLDEAARTMAGWRGGPLGRLRVSVNIAASQFQQLQFAEQVLNVLDRHGAPADRLELEVTESVVMSDIDAVIARLNSLRSAGIRIAIDDFGTGYSSLSYLQDLPLDVLKIDRAFVNRLEHDAGEQSLARTIQLLASSLNLETVAEGVETETQRAAIAAMGCDTMQGYWYSKPVPTDELQAAVERIEAARAPVLQISRAA